MNTQEKNAFERWFDRLLEKTKPRRRPPPDPSQPRYGDINERVLAASVDLFLLYFLLFPLFMWLQHQFMIGVDRELLAMAAQAAEQNSSEAFELFLESGYPQRWLMSSFLQLSILGAVIVAVQCQFNTTPGKKLMGLRIVCKDTHETPGVLRYILRYLAYIPACAPLMIGIIWMSFNKQRRGWHDYVAGTVVLNTRPYGWYWQQIKRGFSKLFGIFKS